MPPTRTLETGTQCETDCTSQGQTVMVIEDMQSTTVALGQGDRLDGEVTLLESQGRGQAGMMR